MKKTFSFALMLCMSAVAANAAPSYIQRDNRGGYNVTYDYRDKAKSGWYLAGHVGANFLNFKNKYTTNAIDVYTGATKAAETDKYSFEPVFDGSLSVGRKIGYFWRAELEMGYMGQFSDKDVGYEYTLFAPYTMLNGYYDFTNGLYLGAGFGVAMPVTKLDGYIFASGDRRKISASPMGGVMLGYTHKLNDGFVLDLRYRLAGTYGHEQKRTIEYDESIWLKNETGFILSNSITVGLRYEF